MRTDLQVAKGITRCQEKNNSNPTQMWKEAWVLCWLHEKTSSSLNPAALTDARNIPCINRARGEAVFLWFWSRQQLRYQSIPVTAFTPLPACKQPQGTAHGSIYNYGAEKGESLHSRSNVLSSQENKRVMTTACQALEAARSKDRWRNRVSQGIMNIERLCHTESSSNANVQ